MSRTGTLHQKSCQYNQLEHTCQNKVSIVSFIAKKGLQHHHVHISNHQQVQKEHSKSQSRVMHAQVYWQQQCPCCHIDQNRKDKSVSVKLSHTSPSGCSMGGPLCLFTVIRWINTIQLVKITMTIIIIIYHILCENMGHHNQFENWEHPINTNSPCLNMWSQVPWRGGRGRSVCPCVSINKGPSQQKAVCSYMIQLRHLVVKHHKSVILCWQEESIHPKSIF